MVEQRSSSKGPYNINVSSVGNTDHGSILIQGDEAHSYTNHTDIKSLIQRLIDDEKMPNKHAEWIEEFSNCFSRNVDYMKYKFGSNYFPAEIVMFMKEEVNNKEVIGTIDNNVYDLVSAIQEYNWKYKIFCLLHIYPCQKIDFFGAKMYAVPSFQFRGLRMLWVV